MPGSLQQEFAGRCYLAQQHGCCLKIPIGVGSPGMPEVSGECDKVPGNCVSLGRAALQRPDSKRVPEIVDAGTWLSRSASET